MLYIRDASGNEISMYTLKTDSTHWNSANIYGSSRVGMYEPNKLIGKFGVKVTNSNNISTLTRGLRRYELSNHLGNVLAVISDKRTTVCNGVLINYYEADVVYSTDYHSFGSSMAGRNLSNSGYKYGFNTQEKTDEIAGEGNHTTALLWEYDTRLGRRWNLDPIKKFYLSPYSVFHNNPSMFIDPNGDDDFFDTKGTYLGTTGQEKGSVIRIVNENITFEQAKEDVGGNTKLLADFKYLTDKIGEENKVMLVNVTINYAEPLGIDKEKVRTGFYEGSAAFFQSNDGTININVSKDNEISKALNDINNFKSVLIHEKEHRDDPSTLIELYHYKATVAEFNNSTTFENTSEEYKNSRVSYAVETFQKAANETNGIEYDHTTQDINKEIQNFNSAAMNAGLNSFVQIDMSTRKVTEYKNDDEKMPTIEIKAKKR